MEEKEEEEGKRLRGGISLRRKQIVGEEEEGEKNCAEGGGRGKIQ